MCCEAETEATIRSAGLKVTIQRMLVACAVRHAGGHITAGQVLSTVRAAQPTLADSTVYRALAALRTQHLVTRTNLGTGDFLYEWATEVPHHHLVCTECSAILRIESGTFRQLEQALRDARGFTAQLEHLVISGRCRTCTALSNRGTGRSSLTLPEASRHLVQRHWQAGADGAWIREAVPLSRLASSLLHA